MGAMSHEQKVRTLGPPTCVWVQVPELDLVSPGSASATEDAGLDPAMAIAFLSPNLHMLTSPWDQPRVAPGKSLSGLHSRTATYGTDLMMQVKV